MILLLLTMAAYLLGSLSFSILIARYKKMPDPRTQGSNNAGTTNMLRLGGKKTALMVLIGDASKGMLSVFLGNIAGVSHFGIALIAFAAVAEVCV